jgi:RHS repeat-associated protein
LQCFSTRNEFGGAVRYISDYFASSCIPQTTPGQGPNSTLSTKNTSPLIRCGSIIQTSNQVVGEVIPLVGVPFSLTHFSSSMTGRIADYKTAFAVSEARVASNILGFTVEVYDDSNTLVSTSSYNSSPNQNYSYLWNGKDTNGIEIWGESKKSIILKTLSNSTKVADKTYSIIFGSLKAKKLGLGGWMPSIWHFYDSASQKVFNGDGSIRDAKAVQSGIYNRVAAADGSEVYYFDSLGRLAITRTGLTGALIYNFSYDANSQKLLNITDAFNKVIKFKYDTLGNINQIVSAENIKTNLVVDQFGYLQKVINPKNEQYVMSYKDAGGLLASFAKPNGVSSTFKYDDNGNLLSDISSGGNSSTLVKTDKGVNAITSLGRLTQNNYDGSTNTEIEIRPSGLTTTYINTPDEQTVSNVISITKSNLSSDPRFGDQVMDFSETQIQNFGTTTTTVENAVNLNDLINPFSINSLSKTITEGTSEFISHYDGLTRTNTVTSKLGRSISTQLDSLERPILEQTGDTLPKKIIYKNDQLSKVIQGNREIKYEYNATKLLTSISNSQKQETNFYYDDAQRLSAKKLPDGRVINYQYDSNNNLVSITPPGRPVHKLNYGVTEQLSSYVPPSLSGSAIVNTLYSYSKDKELTKISRPDGQEINFNYNQTSGLLTSISGSFGIITREYQNELVTKIVDQNNQVAKFGYTGSIVSKISISDSNQNEVYSYQRSPSPEASGKVGTEIIKVKNNVLSTDYHYDDDKFLTKAGSLNLEYNSSNGQLTKTSLDNVTEHYTYNKFGEVVSYKTILNANANANAKLLYAYYLKRDNLGRIISKVEKFADRDDKKHENDKKVKNDRDDKNDRHEKGERDHDDDKIISEYSYDSAGRLIHVHGENRRPSYYHYDLNSNRIEGISSGEAFKAVYDNQDRLISHNLTVFTYNPNGDLLSKSDPLKCDRDEDKDSKDEKKKTKLPTYINTSFIYDVFGNLKQAGRITYQIDPLQRRSARLVNGLVTNKYIYNPEGQLIGELDKDNNLVKTFIYASKSHVPDYFVDSNNERFKLVVDQLGSVRLVVNSRTGEIKQKMINDEFGKVIRDTKPMFQPFGFAGGLYDTETKLVRFGARDYDSEIGRWTSTYYELVSRHLFNFLGFFTLGDSINCLSRFLLSFFVKIESDEHHLYAQAVQRFFPHST